MKLYIEFVNDKGRRVHTEAFPASELVDQLRRLNHHETLVVKKEPPPPCEHNWIVVDHSFSHEFGTKEDVHEECTECGEFRERDYKKAINQEEE